MIYRIAAESVLFLHFSFIAFVILGVLVVARWGWLIILHVPAVAWSFFVETTGRICPLTYAENHLRRLAGQSGYPDGFLEHYLLPIIYPAGLTREFIYLLAAGVVTVNAAFYGWLLWRRRSSRPRR